MYYTFLSLSEINQPGEHKAPTAQKVCAREKESEMIWAKGVFVFELCGKNLESSKAGQKKERQKCKDLTEEKTYPPFDFRNSSFLSFLVVPQEGGSPRSGFRASRRRQA